MSSRSPKPASFFDSASSSLAPSRQPRFLRNAFQTEISSSLGRRPRAKHHSRILIRSALQRSLRKLIVIHAEKSRATRVEVGRILDTGKIIGRQFAGGL